MQIFACVAYSLFLVEIVLDENVIHVWYRPPEFAFVAILEQLKNFACIVGNRSDIKVNHVDEKLLFLF
jgi:hypothetical protein